MGLRFKNLAPREGMHDHLHRARLARLIDASEESPTVVEHVKLVQIDVLHIAARFLAIDDLTDRLVLACDEDRVRRLVVVRLEDFNTGLVHIGHVVFPDGVRLTFFWVQEHHLDGGVERR